MRNKKDILNVLQKDQFSSLVFAKIYSTIKGFLKD